MKEHPLSPSFPMLALTYALVVCVVTSLAHQAPIRSHVHAHRHMHARSRERARSVADEEAASG